VERSCYCIHSADPQKEPPAGKGGVFHTHMPYASALTRLEDPRIKEIGQTEVGLMNEIGLWRPNTPPGRSIRPEGARLARVIGDKSVLFMGQSRHQHGRRHRRRRHDRLYYTERAAQVQIYAMWTGQPLKQLPDAVSRRHAGYRRGSMFDGQVRRSGTSSAQAHPRPQGA